MEQRLGEYCDYSGCYKDWVDEYAAIDTYDPYEEEREREKREREERERRAREAEERRQREERERQQREEAERQAREAEQRRQQQERERQEREARERQQREEQERQRQAPPATTTSAPAAPKSETAPPINGAIDLSQPNGSKTQAKPTEQAKTPTATGANNTNVPAVAKKPRKPLIPEHSKEEKKPAPLAITPPVAPSQIPVQIAPQAPPAPVIIEKKKDNYWWIIAAAVVGYIVLRKND